MAPLADIAIISSVILACLYYFRNKFSFSHIVLFIISGCIIGCINIAYHNHFRISTKTLEKPLYNQEAIGKILRIKDRGKKKYYYIENINNQADITKVRLTMAKTDKTLWPEDIITYKAHYYPLPKPLLKEIMIFHSSQNLKVWKPLDVSQILTIFHHQNIPLSVSFRKCDTLLKQIFLKICLKNMLQSQPQ